ncbi:response regulator [Aquimarina megaterium]|uniref:response regulator n=1 Tax=Aquimarina megaterium TaxID=1443666 RepID=UPI000472612A|nr:response regulator transcription factor [Aquimarina megaterium]
MGNKVRILIVDDSIVFSQGLSALLEGYPTIVENVARVHHYKGAMEILKNSHVDILMLDLNFESADFDGFIIAKKVKKLYPGIKIIILTQQAKVDNYKILIEDIGVHGYLDKQLSVETVIMAIKEVQKDNIYIDPIITEMIRIGKWLTISPREREVIEHLGKGFLQKEVADTLCISHRTVEEHCKNAARKVGAKNTAHLIAIYTQYKNANRERGPDI